MEIGNLPLNRAPFGFSTGFALVQAALSTAMTEPPIYATQRTLMQCIEKLTHLYLKKTTKNQNYCSIC